MILNHHSRKKRQLNSLVKSLNTLLKITDFDVKSEIKKMAAKIKYLVSQLNGIVGTNRMKRILGGLTLFIGISFSNTASAQYFAYPVADPFGLTLTSQVIQSPAFADLDNDGDLDCIKGDMSYSGSSYTLNFVYQENIGSANTPNFSAPNINPFGLSSPVSNAGLVLQFPKFVDLDNDGDFDILSSIVKENGGYSFSSDFMYFENIGTTSIPQFATAVSNPFGLSDTNMIVHINVCDIDNDGDYDIMSSMTDPSQSYYGGATVTTWHENIGSGAIPSFSGAQINPFGLSSIPGFSLQSFLDLDSDGDFDMLTFAYGYSGGIINYTENQGSSNLANFSSTPTANPFGLDISNYEGNIVFSFHDLDGDADNDLIGGNDEEDILYFENVLIQQPVTYECINNSCIDPGTGSGSYAILSACQTNCTAPVTFECDWPGNCYDPTDGSGNYSSYNDCMLDCTPMPTWDCVAPGNCQDPGDESGNYFSLQDCQNFCDATPTWNCDSTLGCIDPGDGSGLYANVAGCQANCNPLIIKDSEINNLKLYPNPVNNTLHISTDKKIKRIEIYDVIGRIVILENNPTTAINVEQLESGLYSIAVLFEDDRIIKRFTK